MSNSTADPAGTTTRPFRSFASAATVVVTVSPALSLRDVMVCAMVASMRAPATSVRVVAMKLTGRSLSVPPPADGASSRSRPPLSAPATSCLARPQATNPARATLASIVLVIMPSLESLAAPGRAPTIRLSRAPPKGRKTSRALDPPDAVPGGGKGQTASFAPGGSDSEEWSVDPEVYRGRREGTIDPSSGRGVARRDYGSAASREWPSLASRGLPAPSRVGKGGDLQASMECKFFQDIVHVALDRVNRDVQPRGHFLVAQALAEQVDHLAFPLGQPHAFQNRGSATAHGLPSDLAEERSRQFGRQHVGAVRHRADGPEEIVKRRVLHDEAGGARAHEGGNILLDRQQTHDDHSGLRNLLADGRRHAQAVVGLQAEIQEDHPGFGFPYLPERLFDVPRRGEDPEIRLLSDEAGEPLAQQPVVVDEHQRDRLAHAASDRRSRPGQRVRVQRIPTS